LTLGGVLIVAGSIKIPHPYKAAAAMRSYELLPTSSASLFGYILPWLEVGLGLFLILGVAAGRAAHLELPKHAAQHGRERALRLLGAIPASVRPVGP
jgi:uncharacterized membrane protein YfcA